MMKRLLPIAGLAAAVLASCSKAPQTGEVDPRIELSDQFTSDFALTDQDGRAVTDEDLKGKTAIVYFGFASCPDVCPMALSRLSAALKELKPKDRDKLVPVFVTVDPERDTPERLKAFLAFDPSIMGLTGSTDAVDQARQSFKVFAKKQVLDGSAAGYTVNHSSLFYVVDPKGQPRIAVNDSVTAVELAEVLKQAANGRY